MRRVLFNLIAEVSALLFIAIVLVTIRSYFVFDDYMFRKFNHSSRQLSLFSPGWNHGVVLLTYISAKLKDDVAPQRYETITSFSHTTDPPQVNTEQWRLEDRSMITGSAFKQVTGWFVKVPFWFPAILTLILPLLWLSKHRKEAIRRDRRNRGLCITCGYDIRATPEMCPECGMKVTQLQ
jgi:hypothetical protein